MKIKIIIASCIILLVALFAANTSSSQEPALDLGETSLIAQTCYIAKDAIESFGENFTSCRRASPDVINGNSAVITVLLKYGFKKVKVQFWFRKSLWSNTAVKELG